MSRAAECTQKKTNETEGHDEVGTKEPKNFCNDTSTYMYRYMYGYETCFMTYDIFCTPLICSQQWKIAIGRSVTTGQPSSCRTRLCRVFMRREMLAQT